MKQTLSKKEIILYTVLLIGLVGLDLWSKAFMASHLAEGESITIMSGFFYITHVHNKGAAWGVMSGRFEVFYAISLIAAGLIIYYFLHAQKKQVFMKTGLVMVMTGLLGNLYDRIAFGYVRDFLNFYIFGYDYPVFNVADMGIVIGVGLIILDTILEERRMKG